MKERLRSLLSVNEEAVVGIWSKGIRKMREQRVADCGENLVPNKKASPQASERRACEGGSLKSKNAYKRADFRRTRKSPPQFTHRK